MADRYLSPKFGVNPLDVFRGNDVYGRTTTDGRTANFSAITEALLCSSTKQSLKIEMFESVPRRSSC